MNCCYILFHPSLGKFYIGITHENLETRIQKHNNQAYGNHRFTAKVSDWELFPQIPAQSFAHSGRIELAIKKMKCTAFIRKLKKNPKATFDLSKNPIHELPTLPIHRDRGLLIRAQLGPETISNPKVFCYNFQF